jgi:hypothetical protein
LGKDIVAVPENEFTSGNRFNRATANARARQNAGAGPTDFPGKISAGSRLNERGFTVNADWWDRLPKTPGNGRC